MEQVVRQHSGGRRILTNRLWNPDIPRMLLACAHRSEELGVCSSLAFHKQDLDCFFTVSCHVSDIAIFWLGVFFGWNKLLSTIFVWTTHQILQSKDQPRKLMMIAPQKKTQKTPPLNQGSEEDGSERWVKNWVQNWLKRLQKGMQQTPAQKGKLSHSPPTGNPFLPTHNTSKDP